MTPKNSDKIAILSDRIVTPYKTIKGIILCEEGKIKAILDQNEKIPEDYKLHHAEDLIVMPGLVDTHVHLNQPGRTHWEGFVTGTKAAAAGGVTTLVDMPLNSTPVTCTPDALKQKISEANQNIWVDCGFWGGLIPANHDNLEPLLQSGVLGVKAFLTYSGIPDFPEVNLSHLQKAMPVIAASGLPLLVHAELESCVSSPADSPQKSQRVYQRFLDSRPDEWELNAIKMMIELAKEFHCPVHIVHLSSSLALPMIAKAKLEGVPMTTETCPHYLTLASENIEDGDTRYKCAPPIRSKANALKLWQGLKEGIIDFIVSDHSPCSTDLKLLESGDFASAWGGISSLQLALPLIASEGEIGLQDYSLLAHYLSLAPAKFAGLSESKGSIEVGKDCDLVLWDDNKQFQVSKDQLFFKHKHTPYLNKTLKGEIHRTYLRGQIVFDKDGVSAKPLGHILRRSF